MTTQPMMPDSDLSRLLPPADRRRHPRIDGPFRARIRGVYARGEEFVTDAELKDFSAGGFYLRLAEQLGREVSLAAEVMLCCGIAGAIRLAATGRVLRAERLIDGRCGVAVAFTYHQFLE